MRCDMVIKSSRRTGKCTGKASYFSSTTDDVIEVEIEANDFLTCVRELAEECEIEIQGDVYIQENV